MARTQAELGELVGKIFDRLGAEFSEASIEDAVLLVEVSDPNHTYKDGAQEVLETIILAESTASRVTIQEGIISFAKRNLYSEAEDED